MIVYEFSQASTEHPDRCEDARVVFNGTNGQSRAQVFGIIDGMGGQQHKAANGNLITGQDAAQIIRDVLIEDLEHLPADIDATPGGAAEQRITAALARANQRIYHELNNGEALPTRNRVGAVSTIAVVCENRKRLLVMQVGDTRGYLYSGGELIQLCIDEDNVEYLVRQHGLSESDAERIGTILNDYDGVHEPKAEGKVTVAGQQYDLYLAWRWFLVGNSALNIPAANVVINTLGLNPNDPVPETSRIEVESGDLLCLCSDGLYKNLTDQEIIAALQSLDDLAKALGSAALTRSQDKSNHRMNPDDITVIVVRF